MMRKELLAELKIILESKDGLSFNKASLLHGVLMEQLDFEYAERLHIQGLKPYSQCVRIENDKSVWYVRTLSEEAYNRIILPLQDESFNSFLIRHNNSHINISNKELNKIYKENLYKDFYSKDASRVYKIEFVSPTAFKRNGGYYNFPNTKNIYSSLMKRYDSISNDNVMEDEETLEHLVDNTDILSYSLYSTSFSLEGVKIPSFMGNITVKIKGSQTMANFANLLFRFGEYSGVGIKTAIGMGSIKVEEKGR